MKNLIVMFFLLVTQVAFASGIDFKINTLRTHTGEEFTWEEIGDVKVALSANGKLEVKSVVLLSGRVIARSEISSVVMMGSTPFEDVSGRQRIGYPTTVNEVSRANGNGTLGGNCQ